MSDEYKKAQEKMMLEQAADVDIIITTALIPGKKAPILVNEDMLSLMKAGSVCVDLAAANGGNVAQTRPDEIVTTSNGVKIIGYTDLPSRLASTASNLFANNIAKFILSVGPQTTKEKGMFQIDLKDDAVQNMLISFDGTARWPDKIVPFTPPAPPAQSTVAEVVQLSPEQEKALADQKSKDQFVKNSLLASAAAGALVAFGLTADSPSAVNLLATFGLAGLAGYQVVWGVAPALHSPLMAVTNAISGWYVCHDFKPGHFQYLMLAFTVSPYLLRNAVFYLRLEALPLEGCFYWHREGIVTVSSLTLLPIGWVQSQQFFPSLTFQVVS
jgi:NAD(P) transhydrogenase